MRHRNNSRQGWHSQPDVGCQPSTSYPTHPFSRIEHSQNGTEAFGSRPAPVPILIANPRLESKLTSKDSSSLQISNRERMAISRRAFSGFPSFKPLTSRPQNLIVTLELEFPVTRTKQPGNQNPNRYKTPLLRPGLISGTRFSRLGCTCTTGSLSPQLLLLHRGFPALNMLRASIQVAQESR
jgi:hypothetical protein